MTRNELTSLVIKNLTILTQTNKLLLLAVPLNQCSTSTELIHITVNLYADEFIGLLCS